MELEPADVHPRLGDVTVGQALLAPTRLYARQVAAVLAAGVDVRAMSHITGGGLPGNLPRVLPDGLGVQLTTWARPAIFELLAEAVDEAELRRVFNLGVGYAFVVPAADVPRARAALVALGEAPIDLGEIVAVPDGTAFEERVTFAAAGRP
jgi:phosphoribosylformylglycinamidine cyclo-ligase